MAPAFFAKLHGASTHFPITLVLCSWMLDTIALIFARRPWSRTVQAAGLWAICAAALTMVPTVVTGLLMTRGSVWGHGMLRLHHLFVWPALALVVGLAVWRVQVRHVEGRKAYAAYLVCGCAAAGLISAAGYWGGELLLAA